MEFVNILSLDGIGTTKDTINFNKAISTKDKEGFSLSGSKLLLSFLRSKLGRVPILIDFSAVPSSLKKNDNKLADFITVFDPTSKFVEKENLDYSFNKVYSTLRDQNLGVFYHPKFFDCPEKPAFYFSKYDVTPLGKFDVDHDYYDIVPEPWFTIDENDLVYFINKSFSISYTSYKEKSEKTLNKKINIQKRNDILLKFYSKYFLRDVSNDERNCYLISIPLIGYPGRETESNIYEGLGAIFVFFIKENFDESVFDIELLGNQLWFLGLQITYNSIFQIAKELADKVQKEATKSAKSAIMSRNMSHNLGSHVMSYLKQHLSSVATMMQDNVLTHLFDSEGDYDKLLLYLQKNVPEFENINIFDDLSGLSSQDKINTRLTLPFLVGLGHFVSYLQERQDFIATIATDFFPYYETVNFKDSVYDELNPDKRYERHPDRINQKLDNILLGNIARSEGLGRSTGPTQKTGGKLCDIVLRYKDFDGNTCKKGTKAYESLEELRQFNVSLPGGIVGRQAIFSIIENVIRNAAKHGSWRGTGKLELTFNKYDPLVDEFPNDDNLEYQKSLKEVIDTYYLPAEDISDLYIITLTDNTTCTNDILVDKLEPALKDDYVDSFGIMKDANKGIKEMRISAAWLRAILDEASCVNPFIKESESTDYIRNNKLRAPILYARLAKNNNETNLQYIFCLPKPKILAVISEYLATKCKNIHINGCKFYSERDFKAEFNKSYEFIICGSSRYKRIRPFSSSRTFTFTNMDIKREEFESLKNEESLSQLLNRLYEKMAHLQNNDIINIDDKKLFNKYTNYKIGEKITSAPVQKITVNDNVVIIDDHLTCEKNDLHVADLSLGNYYRIGNVFVSDGKICGQYIYRRHHDAISQFNKFMDSKVRTEFVESVTGSNSTDRLIRNEDIDNPWFYRHLHAMKMKVAIFDERLFSKITGLEEMDFTRGLFRSAANENLNEIKDYYISIFPDKKELIKRFEYPEELNFYINAVFMNKMQVSKNYSKGLMAATYIQKQVYVYTIIQDVEKTSKFYLIGVALQDNLPKYRDELNHNYDCLCARLAELTWTKAEGLDIKYLNGGEYIDKFFNYLSIHQGLLDKLYESFGIKDVDDKHKLTEKLYNQLFKVKEIIPVNLDSRSKTINCSFLSGMMIHSGRSKPGIEDMPQMLPFIQYAAMEHAVMDCKYSLVNLLENARYEK